MDLFHKEWHLIGTINTDHRWLPKMIVHGEESVGGKFEGQRNRKEGKEYFLGKPSLENAFQQIFVVKLI